MKKNIFKRIILTIAGVALFSGCTKDDDFEVQGFKPMLFADDFSFVEGADNSLASRGYTVFNESGTTKWQQEAYSGDAYAVLDAFGSPDALINAWLITPAINMDTQENEKLLFRSAQAYVTSAANSLEVLISSDFDGQNVLSATWLPLTYNQPILNYDNNFEYVASEVDLSSYTGIIHIAFRYKGSGTNTSIDGTYQIDNIRVIN